MQQIQTNPQYLHNSPGPPTHRVPLHNPSSLPGRFRSCRCRGTTSDPLIPQPPKPAYLNNHLSKQFCLRSYMLLSIDDIMNTISGIHNSVVECGIADPEVTGSIPVGCFFCFSAVSRYFGTPTTTKLPFCMHDLASSMLTSMACTPSSMLRCGHER